MKIILLLLSALLFSCNQSETSTTNPKWECEDSGNNNKQTCNIVFYALNKEDKPVNTTIRIRAHYLENKGKGAKSNIIKGEKTIKSFLSPNEKRYFNETLIVNGRVSIIAITIVNINPATLFSSINGHY